MSEPRTDESGRSIADKSRKVRQQLLDLMTQLNATQDSTTEAASWCISSSSVTDVFERFTLWAGNLGAMRGPATRLSLDYRLSNAQEIRHQILRQLDDLIEAIDDRKCCLYL
jgi:hypothetical protein